MSCIVLLLWTSLTSSFSSFANYVVQTALDYAEPTQRAQLIEAIRPILRKLSRILTLLLSLTEVPLAAMIRNTPYGKRIQSKIQRETSDHMSRSGYHPALVPGGHFYNLQSMPPPQFMQQHHMGQMGGGGEYGARSPYMGGYQGQGQPMHHQQQQQHQQQLQHQQHHQNGSMSQFAPFPGSMGVQDYQGMSNGMQQGGGMGGPMSSAMSSGMGSQMSNGMSGGYAGFM